MLATVWVTDCLSEKLVLNKRLNQNMYFLFPIQGSLALFFNSRHMWTLYYTQDMSRVIFGKLLPREVGRTQHGGGLKLPISWIQHRPPTCGIRVHFPYIVRTSYTAAAQLLILHFYWISVWRHDGRQDILAIFKKKSFMMPLNTPENIAKKERSGGTSSTMTSHSCTFQEKGKKGMRFDFEACTRTLFWTWQQRDCTYCLKYRVLASSNHQKSHLCGVPNILAEEGRIVKLWEEEGG